MKRESLSTFSFILLIAGLLVSFWISQEYRNDARAAWLAQAEPATQWLTGTLLGWLDESYSALVGVGVLTENSDEVSELEFIRSVDSLESKEAVFFIDEMAFIQQTPANGEWNCVYTNNPIGKITPELSIADEVEIQRALQAASAAPGKVALGPSFQSSNGDMLSPVAYGVAGAKTPTVIVGLLNYTHLIESIKTLYVPQGLSLSLQGQFLRKDRPFMPIETNDPGHSVSAIQTRTISAGSELLITWDITEEFLGGPPVTLAWYVLGIGALGSIGLFSFIQFLLRQNKLVELKVVEATKELQGMHESLKQSEAKFRNIVEGYSEGIFFYTHDRDGKFTYVSPSVLNILGYKPEEFMIHFASLLTDDPVNEKAKEHIELTMQGIFQPPYEVEVYHKDGGTCRLEVNEIPMPDEMGEIQSVEGIARDVTEQKRMEEKIRHINFLSDKALDLTKAGYWHVPLDGSGWYNSSERAAAIFGDMPKPPDYRYHIMDEWFENVKAADEELAKSTLNNFQDAIEGKIPLYDSTFAYKRPIDGQVVWIHACGHVVKDEHGKPTDMYGVTQDITVQKHLEEDLRNAKQEVEDSLRGMSMVFQDSADPVIMEDLDGRILEMNREAEKTYGWPQEELIGKSILTIIPPEWHQKTNESLARCIQGDIVRNLEGMRLNKDGKTIPVLVTLSLIKDEEGAPSSVASIAKDITGLKNAENELKKKQQDLEQLIEERTEELHKIERFNRLALDRESRIIELKKEVNQLCASNGLPGVYETQSEENLDLEEPQDEAGLARQETARSAPMAFEAEELSELIDLEHMQSLLQDFCESVEIGSAIIDLEGNVLVAARWQKSCTDFHRVNKDTCARCIESDTDLAAKLQKGEKFSIYRCKNGLTDAASPIVINGHHIANVFVGQFLLQKPDMDFFASQAKQFGFDEAEYLKAIQQVPIVEESKLPNIMGFLVGFANMVATLSIEKKNSKVTELEIKQKSMDLERERAAAMSLAEDAEKARAEKAHYQNHLEELIDERTKELRDKFDQLDRFRRMSVDREKKMIELKIEINELLKQNGLDDRYKIHGAQHANAN